MDDHIDPNEHLNPIQRLTKDLAKAAATLSDTEARFLVDAYYMMQDSRIRSDGQIRSMSEEPHAVLGWLSNQNATLENQIKRALEKYVQAHPVGEWLISVYGIGPVISAGLLAHIDINKASTVGKIWRFAGLDPSVKWNKGQKRPWNARLKVLCWKAGESFVKFHKHEECFYGHLYAEKKEALSKRNERKEFAETAAQALKDKKFDKSTEAYKHLSSGQLPPAQIHARARRYAVKIFLSHLHREMYRRILHQEPPLPFAFAILGHDQRHLIKGPQ